MAGQIIQAVRHLAVRMGRLIIPPAHRLFVISATLMFLARYMDLVGVTGATIRHIQTGCAQVLAWYFPETVWQTLHFIRCANNAGLQQLIALMQPSESHRRQLPEHLLVFL